MPEPHRSRPDAEPARLLGAHMPTAGGLSNSLAAGKEIGCAAVQLFTGSPRQWHHPPLDPEAIEQFRCAREACGIGFTVAHDSYLINLAAPDAEILDRSRKAFRHEIERADALGIPWVVTHMGAHLDSGEETGLSVLIDSIGRTLAETDGLSAGIALETTAGQGTCLGYTFEQLARVLEPFGAEPRLSVCLDTCHVFAAGYDIRDPEGYERTIAAFAAIVGLERLTVIHANDAKRPLGSRVDRHEHIGGGEIGVGAFGRLVTDARLLHVPVIIETPDSETMHAVNLGRLRRLAAAGELGMHVVVRMFGHYRDVVPDAAERHMPAGITVADLAASLEAEEPRLAGLQRYCRAAVNEEYASSDCALHEGDEVAFIPPLSGG